jgi:DinB superfamily
MVEAYLSVLELGYYEVKVAFEGLADENVWKRPTEGLLSVGELAGHIAYWEAVKLAGEGKPDLLAGEGKPDLAKCRVSSPLIDHRFGYYPTTIANPPSEQHLAMTAEQVCGELLRVHEEAVAHFKALNPDLESTVPGWPPNYTYGEFLKYAVFHVSYHAGQMYSVRHLLGEETPDN